MTFSMRTVIRPHLLLDVVTGELLADRAVVVDGSPGLTPEPPAPW